MPYRHLQRESDDDSKPVSEKHGWQLFCVLLNGLPSSITVGSFYYIQPLINNLVGIYGDLQVVQLQTFWTIKSI